MSKEDDIELIRLLEEQERRKAGRLKLASYYPDTGPLRRELYPKHTSFFEAGATFSERLMLAANRIGKTESIGAYEVTCHLTGLYPKWWVGRRFNRPTDWWAGGDTALTVRDILQAKLLGPLHLQGSGLIPADRIWNVTKKKGIADAVDTVLVKHVSGGISQLGFKSFAEGRESWQGTKKDGIWLDEEPPLEIHTEALLRTMDTSGAAGAENGLMILTFTPLRGMSEVVIQYLPGGKIGERSQGSKCVIMATWDDAPHLTKEARDALWASIPPFQRDARSKGIPQLGAGAIYPVPESDIVIPDFQIPEHFLRGFSMDVGWNRTSAGLWALDREQDILYRIGEHYRGEAEPVVHANAIKSRMKWQWPGVMDPAARGRQQKDGAQLLQDYKDLGLDVEAAFNGVESGIYEVWQRLSSGRLKVFESCQNWLFEFRLYRRDEKGRIVKENDHAMDDTRYMVMSGIERMKIKPPGAKEQKVEFTVGSSGQGWMG